MSGTGGITVGLNHAEDDERRRAKENNRNNLRRWLPAFVSPCVCVYACVDQFRACVNVGRWIDAGLCEPMTVTSANNAIGTILKLDFFSGRTADLHMSLRSWCTLLVVRVAIVSQTSVYFCML